MLLKNKLDEVKKILADRNVLSTLEERYCYSEDASNVVKRGKTPDLVVFVESIEDVCAVVRYANQHEIPVVARGAGTNMVGACVCAKGGIVLNFSKMNKILEINSCNMTATVQAGTVLGDLKELAASQGLFFPPDPSNFRVSTIGGAIAQSSGGAMSFKYGTMKDYVLSLKVVTAEGQLITMGCGTIKDAVGYHLAQLMVGSEGTLGIVVEATLKLIPKPETRRSILAYFNSFVDAVNVVGMLIQEHIFPAAIDFMDNNSIVTVEEFSGCGMNTNAECMLLIDVDGMESSVDVQLDKIASILRRVDVVEFKIAGTEEQSERFWQARRVSYAATSRLAPDVLSDDIVVPRDRLAEMIAFCNEISRKYDLKMCLVGHVGDGNIHPQIALNLETDDEFVNYQKAKSEMYKKAVELGGTISAEHGIGVEKLPYLENTIDKNSLEYMKSIKRVFDPKNILNPEKIFKL